jgi:hypothetical protein
MAAPRGQRQNGVVRRIFSFNAATISHHGPMAGLNLPQARRPAA